MAREITDEEDRLKRQARRRLIGAVALTTAVVVVLPMVLDSEPKPIGQNIELRIPDKDKVGEFAPSIDLPHASAPVAVQPASQVVAVSAPAPTPAPVPAMPSPAPAPKAAVVPPPVAVAPVPAPPPEKPAVAVPEHKPEPAKHDTKPAQAKPAQTKPAQTKSAQTKHVAKPTETARTEQGQPVPRSGFIVQIGAFNNADTAHSWQKNLKAEGFKAYTEKLGEKTRVRIGPYSTRAAANAARHKLEKTQHLHSNIVELN